MNLAYVIDTDWIIDHFNGIEAVTRQLADFQPAGHGWGRPNPLPFTAPIDSLYLT